MRNNGQDTKTDVSQFLRLGKASEFGQVRQIDMARESLGTPILIQREKGKIILSQQKGALLEKPAVISWKAKEQ